MRITHESLENLEDIVIGDINYGDYPKFCDVYMESASLDDTPLTEKELDYINESFPEFINERVFKTIC